jgi:phosphatidate cytidylyltransferase
MKKRVLVSVIVIPVLVFFIYAPYVQGLLFTLFIIALCILAAYEIHRLTGNIVSFKRKGASLFWFVVPPLLLLGAGITNRFVNTTTGAMLYTAAGIAAGLCAITIAVYGLKEGIRRLPFHCTSFGYVGVCTLLLLQLHEGYRGFMHIYFILFTAWVNDAAAYIIGSRFGRTRGVIACSPNKSVEGYVGAFVVTMILVNGFKLAFRAGFEPTLLQSNLLGFCIALTAPLGDLMESCYKRKAGVKDSSALFPELGGVLDIFDSVLFSVPVYYIFVSYIF